MKLATYWWGIEILAEDNQDHKILVELKHRLPEKADSCYEHGDVSWLDIERESHENGSGFTENELESAISIISIDR